MKSIDGTKYREAILYLLSSPANNAHLGKVKLMKLLYYSDFDHYERFGHSITGDSYVHLDYGPVPRIADLVLNSLADAGEISISRTPGEFSRYVYVVSSPRRAYQALTKDELETLASVVKRWQHASRRDIVLASHGEPPWRMTDHGEEIPYHLVFYRDNAGGRTDEEPPLPEVVTRSKLAS